jgi:hypothetical protein
VAAGAVDDFLMAAVRRSPWQRPLLVAVVLIHVMAVLGPVDVLFPVDAWTIGQRLLHGDVPYRDFQFEYPPLSLAAFVLPGLVPRGLADHVLALQAVALEVVALLFIRRRPGAVGRYALLSLLMFPFLAGGIDAFPMAALAVSTALLADGRPVGWVVAALGGMVKVIPGVAFAWCRRHLAVAGVLFVVTAAVLLAPLALADKRNDDWISYNVNRGVQVESVAATTTWVANGVTGTPSKLEYRFKALEIAGASGPAAVFMVAGIVAMAWLALRSRGRDAWWLALLAVDIFLISSKVLSPQYIAWTAPLAAVVGGRLFRLHLLMAALTVAAFTVGQGQAAMLGLIAIRNVVLLGTVGWGLWSLRRAPASTPTPAEPASPDDVGVGALATRPA